MIDLISYCFVVVVVVQVNTGQTDGPPGVDLNLMNVWKQGYTGRGIVISVLDDGLDHTHPDLEPNYVSCFSLDFF